MDSRKRARILSKIQSGRATRAERMFLKQEGLCFYCWEPLETDITKEHLHSRAEGGGNERSNLRVAHMPCNGIVGTLPVEMKMELHEIGRDQGAEAFWQKAKEFQSKYGEGRMPYASYNAQKRRNLKKKKQPARGDVREVTAEDAALELEKMELGRIGLSRAEKRRIYEEEVEKRKATGLPVRITFVQFMRKIEAMEAAGVWVRGATTPVEALEDVT